MKKGLYILSAVALLVTACGKKEEAIVVKPKKPVVVSVVEKEVVSDLYVTDGTLLPQEKVNHTLDSQGTVVTVLKQNGDFVKKGEVVVKFKDATTEADYNAAKFNYESTKNNFEKFNTLYEKQMVSQLEFLSYRDAYTNAVADFLSKKSNFEKLTRKSEITGLIGNLDLKPGNVVEANKTVFTVVDENIMDITVDFPGYWLNSLKVGSPAKVKVSDLGGKEFVAKVKEINPIADSETKKFPVKLSIENKNMELKDGMYSKVTIPTEKRDGIVVPQAAVFIRDLLSYVYKIEDGKAKRVEVTTGATAKPNIEILESELNVGDKVVSDGIFGLADGDEITINNETK
ncbi:efflux RND transporter periplasmic adaptor subunit [uncultured Cetobacterium sp.]|uniref:efflux RND transporter periplasmic adaptor subunit n=1 Tax=uncultured Cetobacterium sp. TaxID=527638 RepID=UPI002615CADF|nr:efflux RND transporter periplasmic adaptor subunit [uncultured Cetobacterium sp.]